MPYTIASASLTCAHTCSHCRIQSPRIACRGAADVWSAHIAVMWGTLVEQDTQLREVVHAWARGAYGRIGGQRDFMLPVGPLMGQVEHPLNRAWQGLVRRCTVHGCEGSAVHCRQPETWKPQATHADTTAWEPLQSFEWHNRQSRSRVLTVPVLSLIHI